MWIAISSFRAVVSWKALVPYVLEPDKHFKWGGLLPANAQYVPLLIIKRVLDFCEVLFFTFSTFLDLSCLLSLWLRYTAPKPALSERACGPLLRLEECLLVWSSSPWTFCYGAQYNSERKKLPFRSAAFPLLLVQSLGNLFERLVTFHADRLLIKLYKPLSFCLTSVVYTEVAENICKSLTLVTHVRVISAFKIAINATRESVWPSGSTALSIPKCLSMALDLRTMEGYEPGRVVLEFPCL